MATLADMPLFTLFMMGAVGGTAWLINRRGQLTLAIGLGLGTAALALRAVASISVTVGSQIELPVVAVILVVMEWTLWGAGAALVSDQAMAAARRHPQVLPRWRRRRIPRPAPAHGPPRPEGRTADG